MDIQPPGKRKNPVAYWKVKFDASQQLVRELKKKKKKKKKKKNNKKITPAVGTSGACNSTENQTKIVQKKNKLLPKFMALRLEKMIADCPVN